MSKKRDPLVSVIQYFNTVDLPAAEQAVTVVREIVRSRQPPRGPVNKKAAAPAKRRVEQQPLLPLAT